MMDEQTKIRVWQMGLVIPGYDPGEWRRDEYGNAISFWAYGNRSSVYGWEIDHVIPLAKGGTDILSNLRPLHWRVNARRQ